MQKGRLKTGLGFCFQTTFLYFVKNIAVVWLHLMD